MSQAPDAWKKVRAIENMRLTEAEQRAIFTHLYGVLKDFDKVAEVIPPHLMDAWLDFYMRHYGERRNRPKYLTGFPILDQALGGLSPVTVLLGMPGQGKTTFALQTMMTELEAGTPILFLSFDITRHDVITHLLRRLTGFSFAQIIEQGPGVFLPEYETALSAEDQATYKAAVSHLEEVSPLLTVITQADGIVISEEVLQKEIDRIAAIHERAPLVVVDYIGAMAPYLPDGVEPAVERAMHMISRLSQKNESPWLVLSQRSRANYGNPGLDGGKGSGEIEAKAYTVLSLDKRLDLPDEVDYPAWVKTADQKQKFTAQLHGRERIEALIHGRKPKVSSNLILHIGKDRNAMGGGASGGAINFTMEHGFLVEEPIEPQVNIFGKKGAV